MIKYKYKDLNGKWHVFKYRQNACRAYRRFIKENDLFNGYWLADKNKYVKLAAYDDNYFLHYIN